MSSQLAVDALRARVRDLPDDGLRASRLDALNKLEKYGLPGTRHEDWKYTDLSSVIDISNEWLRSGSAPAAVPDTALKDATDGLDVNWLILRNGVIDQDSMTVVEETGLEVRLLSGSENALDINAPLADLNIALLRDGLSIVVPASYADERPIGLLHIDSADTGIGVSQTRVEITLQPGSNASFLEYHTSSGKAAHYANNVVEISLGKGARASYLRLQERDALHSQTARLRAVLSAGSDFSHAAFDLGGNLVRNDLDIRLGGADSSAFFCGLYLANGSQHVDNHTRVDHQVGPARSEQEYRGIIADKARCVWNGKAIVHPGADGTDAYQANHNLLLSERSEVDAKPELEIYADDVKCSHGTTVGQLDEAALYYLRTRGIDSDAARHLLTRAFAQKIVDLVPIESLRENIGGRVASKLSTLISGTEQ